MSNIMKYTLEKLTVESNSNIADAIKNFDFDELYQDYRGEFVNGGGYSRSDTFERGTDPYDVFEWFQEKLSKTVNAETGDAWQETKIFDENATLKEVMRWANVGYDGEENDYSKKRITITKPHTEDKSNQF